MARAWLQHLRESAIFKVEGLDDRQLRWQPTPTANPLGVLVVHLGYTERLWLRAICAGEPMDMGWRAHMFELPEGWGVEETVAFYRQRECAGRRRPRRGRLSRPPLPGGLPPDDVPLGRVPPHRGGGTPRRAHGPHPRVARRKRGSLSPSPRAPACSPCGWPRSVVGRSLDPGSGPQVPWCAPMTPPACDPGAWKQGVPSKRAPRGPARRVGAASLASFKFGA